MYSENLLRKDPVEETSGLFMSEPFAFVGSAASRVMHSRMKSQRSGGESGERVKCQYGNDVKRFPSITSRGS